MVLPLCRSRSSLDFRRVHLGMTIHLAGNEHCRAFVVTSEQRVDPITGHSSFQVMEVGDDPVVEDAAPPFTGVVLNIDVHAMRAWHSAAT